ncbi:hypothetical protein GCM10010435_36350 [Winogradskya consettensis]|uniref:Uncharacterized protein n=1 Tax=Winogradskya consettensis TaxID=113560 RepID=A0A919VW53_9ACTN|nr:hypothetical protein [Actinoplanes consettensis]GIM81702.1 hypothetical protein Aco04nite_77900 [Actinoplanes consettensis]
MPIRGDGISTGSLTAEDLRALGLEGVVRDTSHSIGGREINLIIYRPISDAAARKPTIKVRF